MCIKDRGYVVVWDRGAVYVRRHGDRKRWFCVTIS